MKYEKTLIKVFYAHVKKLATVIRRKLKISSAPGIIIVTFTIISVLETIFFFWYISDQRETDIISSYSYGWFK